MVKEGHGGPPCPYAVAVLGSAGRGESLLAMDQDNAIFFSDGDPGGAEDQWFARLGGYIADILHEVGVPYCKGGVMGRNPQWRGSLATWRKRIGDWVRRSRPEDLLSVDIFFDLRGVYGEVRFADELWRTAFNVARENINFIKLLAESAGKVDSGLTFLGAFRTVEGRIDLKKVGLFGIVSAARVLAIRHHVVERATAARLAGVMAHGVALTDVKALAEAQKTLLDLIVEQQIEDVRGGRPATIASGFAQRSKPCRN
jgi:DNA polymerase-3 subunit epsilon/CBS domain-containing protein